MKDIRNPVSCSCTKQSEKIYKIPVLVVVFNIDQWFSIHNFTAHYIYPELCMWQIRLYIKLKKYLSFICFHDQPMTYTIFILLQRNACVSKRWNASLWCLLGYQDELWPEGEESHRSRTFLPQEWPHQGLQDPQWPGKNFAIEHNHF